MKHVKCNLNLMKCNVCIEAISVMEVNKRIYDDMIAQTKKY
jgi:predicted small metal-binding protein